MTVKFSLSVAREAIYDLLGRLAADDQPHAQDALLGMMWKDEFKAINLTDGPSAHSADLYAKSGADDWDWAALAYAATTYYGVNMYTATVVNVPNTTWTAPVWSSPSGELYDYGDMWTNPNSYIVIPADGKYLFIAGTGCHWQGYETIYAVRVRKTSGTAATVCEDWIEYDSPPPFTTASGNNNVGRLVCCGMYECSEDDRFEMQVYQNSGGTRNMGPVTLGVSLQGQRS